MKKLISSLFVFYVVVTGASDNSPTSVQVDYELRNNDSGDVLVHSGSVSLQYIRSDAKDVSDRTLTSEERIALVRNQFTEFATSLIRRSRAAIVDKDSLKTGLVGLTISE